MLEWLQSLSPESFMPHGHCYLWQANILWTHIISDLAIATAYFAIPAVLAVILVHRRKSLPYPEIMILFIAFIAFCGLTHVFATIVTWYPLYEQQGWLKAVTALISVATAVVLIPKLPKLISLPSALERLEATQESLAACELHNQRLTTIYNDAINREERIVELKKEINLLLKANGKSPKYLMDPKE